MEISVRDDKLITLHFADGRVIFTGEDDDMNSTLQKPDEGYRK